MAAPSATVAAKKTLRAAINKKSTSVSCYLSIPGEVDTSSLVLSILRSGKKLFVPKVEDGLLHMVRLYGEEDFRTLRCGVWGIKEPAWEWENRRRESATDPESEGLDLILMPGVAFDRSFNRIGYGKGYYDRFLRRYSEASVEKQRAPPVLAALALKEQLLEAGKIPVEEHDWKMDMVVTGEGIIRQSDSNPLSS